METKLEIIYVDKSKLKKYASNPRKLRDKDGIKKLRVLIFINLLRGGVIGKLGILLSDTYSYRYKLLYVEIIKAFLKLKSDGFDVWLVFATTHLKITLIQCGDNYYQIEGSMNYSINNLCEQVSIENDKEVYDYDYNLLNNVIAKKKNHALRRIC